MDVSPLIAEGEPYDSVVLLFPSDDAKDVSLMSI